MFEEKVKISIRFDTRMMYSRSSTLLYLMYCTYIFTEAGGRRRSFVRAATLGPPHSFFLPFCNWKVLPYRARRAKDLGRILESPPLLFPLTCLMTLIRQPEVTPFECFMR